MWRFVQLAASVLLMTIADAVATPSYVHAQNRQKFTNLTDHTSDYPEERVNGASIVNWEAPAAVIAAAHKIFPGLKIEEAMLPASMGEYKGEGVASELCKLLAETINFPKEHIDRVTHYNEKFSQPIRPKFSLSFLESIQKGIEDEKVRKLATRLRDYQFQVWLSEEKSPSDVFKQLNLHTSPIAWDNPLYSVFVSYVPKLQRYRNKNAHRLLFDMLAEYHDEGALYEMVFAEALEKDRSLMPSVVYWIARAIEMRWANERLTADALFKRFFPINHLLRQPSHNTLTSEVTEMLQSVRIKVWYVYVDHLHQNSAKILLDLLLKFCGDRSEPVDQALADVRHASKSNMIAQLVQAELFKA